MLDWLIYCFKFMGFMLLAGGMVASLITLVPGTLDAFSHHDYRLATLYFVGGLLGAGFCGGTLFYKWC